MKQLLIVIFAIVIMISLVLTAFTINQIFSEEQRLKSDLQHRSTLLADSLKESVEPNFINKSHGQLQSLVNRFDTEERLAGMNIYDNKGNPIATSSSLPIEIPEAKQIAADAMDQNKENGDFIEVEGRKMYFLATPLHDAESVVGAMMIAQNAGYIDKRLEDIWRNNLIRLFVQLALVSVALLILLRWIIYEPIRNLVSFLKSARSENLEQISKNPTTSFLFKPLFKEVANIRRSLHEARSVATEEARLRMEKLDSPWTAHRLKAFMKDILNGREFIVVSNREPYIHTREKGEIRYHIPASGMVTAIEPLMQSCGGTWIAHGSGDADKLVVDSNDKVQVPPDEPKYTLKRIWLTDKEELGYYYGYSNEGLYPLCLIAHVRPIFNAEAWEEYKKVNGKFAQAVLAEIKDRERPIIFVQDFHLALLPRMIKNARPDATIAIFWHIPWPNPESFTINPWKKEILDGMLGADLIAFHTQLYCNNFIETVGKELESLIDLEQFSVTRDNHIAYIKAYPSSIDFPDSLHNVKDNNDKKLLKDLGVKTKYIGVGVDRLDYTKGLLEKIKGIEIFLRTNPSYQNNFTFIQIAPVSKSKIKKYQQFTEEVEKEVERVNSLFKKNGWKPIILLKRHHSREEIFQFYKLANLCLVTPIHDGMNLVAKEFIAARDDRKGVLILSQYTGASRELKDALIINPYNAVDTAEAIKIALEMPITEQTKRMKNLREIIKGYNIYRWSAEILRTLVNLG